MNKNELTELCLKIENELVELSKTMDEENKTRIDILYDEIDLLFNELNKDNLSKE